MAKKETLKKYPPSGDKAIINETKMDNDRQKKNKINNSLDIHELTMRIEKLEENFVTITEALKVHGDKLDRTMNRIGIK